MIDAFGPSLLQLTTPAPPGDGGALVDQLLPALVRAAWFLLGFLVVFVIGWYGLEPTVARVIEGRNRNNPTVGEAITRYLRLVVVVVAVVVGLSLSGYGWLVGDSALVVAAGTLAVGVAGQTVIGSLISGLVLVADPEFNIGNYITWADGEGTIRSITLRVTRVQTPNGELITIPNTVLTGQAITRPYGPGRYRVVEHVGLGYEADVDRALGLIEAAAGEEERIAEEPEPRAYVDEFGSDAVLVRVHYWIEEPQRRDVFDVRSAFAQRVKARLDAAEVTIAPPSKRELMGRIEVREGERTA